MFKAHAVPVPSDSVLAPLYVGADLLDAYAIQLPVGADDDLEVLARGSRSAGARWVRAAGVVDSRADAGARCDYGDARRQIVSRGRCCRGGAGGR